MRLRLFGWVLLWCIFHAGSFVSSSPPSPSFSVLNWNRYELFHRPERDVVLQSFSSDSSRTHCLHGMIDSMLLAYVSGHVLELDPSDLFQLLLHGMEEMFALAPDSSLFLNRTQSQRQWTESRIRDHTWRQLSQLTPGHWDDYLDLTRDRLYRSFFSAHSARPCPPDRVEPSYRRVIRPEDPRLRDPPGYARIFLTSRLKRAGTAGLEEWTGLYEQIKAFQQAYRQAFQTAIPLWFKRIQACVHRLQGLYRHPYPTQAWNATTRDFLRQVLYPVADGPLTHVTGWILLFFPSFVHRSSVHLWEFPSGLLHREFTWSRPTLLALPAPPETLVALVGWAPAKLQRSLEHGWTVASSQTGHLIQRVYDTPPPRAPPTGRT